MKVLKKMGLSAVCATFMALPLSAVELPAGGSYEELAKLVPSDAMFVFYEDVTAINQSGWAEKLRALPNTAKLAEQKPENQRGSVIVFGNGFEKGMPNIAGLVYHDSENALEELAKAGETPEAALMPFKFEKFEQDGQRGLIMRIPGTPLDVRLVELAPHWLMFGLGGQGIAEYRKLPQDKLGINPELAAVLEQYKGKMMFGALLLPKDKNAEVSNFEFFGDFGDTDAVIKFVCVFVDEQKAAQAKQSFDQAMPGVIKSLDQSMPGMSALLGDALTSAVEGKNMTITITLPAEKLDKFIGIFGEMFKAHMAAMKAKAAAASAPAATSAPEPAASSTPAVASAPAATSEPAASQEKETPATK